MSVKDIKKYFKLDFSHMIEFKISFTLFFHIVGHFKNILKCEISVSCSKKEK